MDCMVSRQYRRRCNGIGGKGGICDGDGGKGVVGKVDILMMYIYLDLIALAERRKEKRTDERTERIFHI